QRFMMTSEAYQMSSDYDDAASTKNDPEDTYFWWYRIQRLEGEIVRDNIMFVAGSIDLKIGGSAIFPHVEEESLKALFCGIWRNHDDGREVWRRSVYIYQKRALVFPMLQTFDMSDQSQAFGVRYVSTVPTQALTLMNDDFVIR